DEASDPPFLTQFKELQPDGIREIVNPIIAPAALLMGRRQPSGATSMPAGQLSPLVQYLRRIVPAPGQAEDTDRELLDRFVRTRDESAFATLVKRHGPMVLRVCRTVLGDSQDTEDAFQAAFLVLVRKVGAAVRPRLLAPWLCGVAYRVALKTRT